MHLKPERNPLVSAEWLSKNLEKVVPVDATYYNVYQRSMIKGPEHTPLQDMENILNWILKKEKKKLPRDISTDASAQFEMGHIPVFCILLISIRTLDSLNQILSVHSRPSMSLDSHVHLILPTIVVYFFLFLSCRISWHSNR
jgi:hypothetical protein